MAKDEEKPIEGKGFTVQDRRRFSPETGEARENASSQRRLTQHSQVAVGIAGHAAPGAAE